MFAAICAAPSVLATAGLLMESAPPASRLHWMPFPRYSSTLPRWLKMASSYNHAGRVRRWILRLPWLNDWLESKARKSNPAGALICTHCLQNFHPRRGTAAAIIGVLADLAVHTHRKRTARILWSSPCSAAPCAALSHFAGWRLVAADSTAVCARTGFDAELQLPPEFFLQHFCSCCLFTGALFAPRYRSICPAEGVADA